MSTFYGKYFYVGISLGDTYTFSVFCGLSILCCYIAVFVKAQFIIQRPLILATFTEDNGRKDEHLPPYPDQLAFHRVPSLGLCSEQRLLCRSSVAHPGHQLDFYTDMSITCIKPQTNNNSFKP